MDVSGTLLHRRSRPRAARRAPRTGLAARVDTAAFSPAHRDSGLRGRLAPSGEVLVGFVGRLAAEKQVEDLAVLGDLPGIRLVVIGRGPERERLSRRLPGAHFTGLLTGTDLSRMVASLDVVVHPGPHETFCQAAQEAMASGVPVVAVGAGGLRDLVDSSRTGWLYPPGDLAALRAYVADLAGDDSKRTAMGRAAHHAVRARTWPVVCDRLLCHYDQAARSVGAMAPKRSAIVPGRRYKGNWATGRRLPG